MTVLPRPRIAVRPVGPFDLPALAELHARCFEEAWDETTLAGLLASPGCIGLIAVGEADATLGFGLVRIAADEAEILALGTAPTARRRGIADALVDAAVSAARRRGAGRIWLEVAADNAPAQALYRRHGFAAAGRRPGYYRRRGGQRVDAFLYSLVLREA
jgi:ribosomal-protein-alanine N-acetyltransferase